MSDHCRRHPASARSPHRVAGDATDAARVQCRVDPDAFEVPTGREEVWRFTPLRRLRGLHAGEPSTRT